MLVLFYNRKTAFGALFLAFLFVASSCIEEQSRPRDWLPDFVRLLLYANLNLNSEGILWNAAVIFSSSSRKTTMRRLCL